MGDFYLKTMSRGSKSKVESSRSSLLSLQENEKLEDLLGRRCAVSSEVIGELVERCEDEYPAVLDLTCVLLRRSS